MLWLKRNVFFVAGLAVAAVLLGVAAFNLLGKRTEDQEISSQLDEQTQRLREMYSLPIFPSADNIRLVRYDQQRLSGFIGSSRKYFAPIPPVPVVNAQAFKTALDNAIYRFNNLARSNRVSVPTNNYAYSFDTVKQLISFAPESIRPLASQLAEVETILRLLFAAQVNRLEGVQRARVAAEDFSPMAAATYYVDPYAPTTNYAAPAGVLSVTMPYRLTFRCFSAELAKVVEGLAQSPHGFLIKGLDVEPAALEPSIFTPTTYAPPPIPPPVKPGQPRRGPGGRPLPPGSSANVPTNRTGLVTILNERPYRVSLQLQVVNLR